MTAFSATVPANTEATLYLPVNDRAGNFASATGAKYIGKTTRNNVTVAQYELTSGSFDFTIDSNGVTVK